MFCQERVSLKKIIFCVLLYPFLLIFFVALPLEIWDASYIPLSEQAANKVLEHERQALGISSDVPINLILVDEKFIVVTNWTKTGQETSFEIRISRDHVFQNSIQHEMCHVARILRKGFPPEENWIKQHWFRYFYVEEPLAIVYEYFGFDLG